MHKIYSITLACYALFSDFTEYKKIHLMWFWFHWPPSRTVASQQTKELIQWTLFDSLDDLHNLDVV